MFEKFGKDFCGQILSAHIVHTLVTFYDNCGIFYINLDVAIVSRSGLRSNIHNQSISWVTKHRFQHPTCPRKSLTFLGILVHNCEYGRGYFYLGVV